MPKTSLRGELEVKAPGARSFKKSTLELEWEGRYLYFKKLINQKINLSETLRWEVFKEKVSGVKKKSKRAQERRIISLTMRHKGKNTDWKFAPPNENFNTWLYWLLVSIQKHAKIPLSDKRLDNLRVILARLSPGSPSRVFSAWTKRLIYSRPPGPRSTVGCAPGRFGG